MYKNHSFNLKQQLDFSEVKHELLYEQFGLLYKSIQNIANAKYMEDKFRTEISTLQDRLDKVSFEFQSFMMSTGVLVSQRDTYLSDINTMIDAKK